MLDVAIEPAGLAGLTEPTTAATHFRGRAFQRSRSAVLVRFGAMLLALVAVGAPGPSIAGATAAVEWPTSPDNGPEHAMTYRLVRAPEQALVRGQEVLVVQEPQPLTGRQRRLLRRADRHARKAARLRAKSGLPTANTLYVVAAPPPARPAAYNIVVRGEHDDCDDDHEAHRVKVVAAPGRARGLDRVAVDLDRLGEQIERELAAVDFDAIAADVERQVEHALRGAEQARGQADRVREQADRHRERAGRELERAQRKAEKAQRRGEAVQREVERAMRDGTIDDAERRRIGDAARAARHAR